MLIWRLTRPEFSSALDGEGSRLNGGRWNSIGVPVIYCASTLSLAVLEYFVHIPPILRQAGNLPELQAIGLEVPDNSVSRLDDLAPTDGQVLPASQSVGDRWVGSGTSLGLLVPSIVIPRESNLLLNPRHPRMAEVRVVVREAFRFDERLGG